MNPEQVKAYLTGQADALIFENPDMLDYDQSGLLAAAKALRTLIARTLSVLVDPRPVSEAMFDDVSDDVDPDEVSGLMLALIIVVLAAPIGTGERTLDDQLVMLDELVATIAAERAGER